MNLQFRAKDHLAISLLLLCAISFVGFRYLKINQFALLQTGHAIEIDEASQDTTSYDEANYGAYRFELNVNHATWPELTLLPGIGEKLAQRIVEYREQSGAIRRLGDLADVEGIGPKKMQVIREFLRTGTESVDNKKNRNGV